MGWNIPNHSTEMFSEVWDREQGASDDNAPVQSELQEQLQLLQHSGVAGLEDITPEDYITVDSKVMVAEELTTESIVAQDTRSVMKMMRMMRTLTTLKKNQL